MEFMEYITENALILIPVLYVIGMFLKALEFIKDKYIRCILLAIGIAFSIALINELTEDRKVKNSVFKYLRQLRHNILDVTLPVNYTNSSSADIAYGVNKANNLVADGIVKKKHLEKIIKYLKKISK